jgi:hypothetical protein
MASEMDDQQKQAAQVVAALLRLGLSLWIAIGAVGVVRAVSDTQAKQPPSRRNPSMKLVLCGAGRTR